MYERKRSMANSVSPTSKKIALLDQMLEDLAGDEIDDFELNQSSYDTQVFQQSVEDALIDIDNLH